MSDYFTPQDYFSKPAIKYASRVNQTRTFEYKNDTVTFEYNDYGYRTYDLDSVPDNYILVFGSSHTDGYGLDIEERWTSHLEKLCGIPIYNLGSAGCDSTFIVQNIINWLDSSLAKPRHVIIDWTPICRLLSWQKGNSEFSQASAMGTTGLFMASLAAGDENFWIKWTKDVILVDTLCRLNNVSIVHLYLDADPLFSTAEPFLNANNIHMHVDEKIPGKTWHYDNASKDGFHHSANCHQNWAKRIFSIIQ